MADMVKFLKGTLAGYQALSSKDNNSVYITTDEGGIYLGGKRLGDYIRVADIDALKTRNLKSADALYYAEAENVLARWKPDDESQPNGTGKWVQINAAGLMSVDDSATGNVVTGLEVVANEKGERILKAKKSNMATSTQFDTLSQKVTQVEAGYKNADTALKKALLDGADGTYAGTIKGAYEAAATAASAASTADGKAVDAQGTADSALAKANSNATAITAMDAAYKAADTALEKKLAAGTGGDSSFATGKYKNISTLSAAIEANEGTLSTQAGLISGNSGEISTLKGQMSTANNNITGLQTSVNTLNGLMTGDGDGSVNKRLADLKKEILTGDSAEALGETYDTLLEISNWIGTHGQAATDLTGRVAAVESKATGNTNAITALQAADTAIGTRIDGVESAYKAADLALRKELTGNNSGTGAATGTYKTIDALSEKLVAAEGNITAHGTKIATAEGKITALEAADTAIGNRITGVESAYAAADTALRNSIMGTGTDLAYSTITALSTQVATNKSDISTIKGNITTINTSITAINSQLTWGEF